MTEADEARTEGNGVRARERARMVAQQLETRGIRDPRVLDAMRAVPRDAFVEGDLAHAAYADAALPIAAGQTISQPFIVALMVEALRLAEDGRGRVLEVGAGSGYAAAVLAELAGEVYAIERQGELVPLAEERLRRLGYTNVALRHGDGTLGWPEHAPYDGIVVSAGGPRVPPALRDQLALGGRLVIPVGGSTSYQDLVVVTRVRDDEWQEERLEPVRFVPLVGEQGWEGEGTVGAS